MRRTRRTRRRNRRNTQSGGLTEEDQLVLEVNMAILDMDDVGEDEKREAKEIVDQLNLKKGDESFYGWPAATWHESVEVAAREAAREAAMINSNYVNLGGREVMKRVGTHQLKYQYGGKGKFVECKIYFTVAASQHVGEENSLMIIVHKYKSENKIISLLNYREGNYSISPPKKLRENVELSSDEKENQLRLDLIEKMRFAKNKTAKYIFAFPDVDSKQDFEDALKATILAGAGEMKAELKAGLKAELLAEQEGLEEGWDDDPSVFENPLAKKGSTQQGK
jgi:hypothetical protein